MLDRLRAGTRPLHERLEARLDVLGRAATREGYVALLGRLLGFHAPFEAAMARWDEAALDLGRRRKAPLLVRDLRALGLDAAAIDALPRCPPSALPPAATFACALGCLYVVEGSTLGGRVLARHVRARLALTPDAGLAFFSGYGADTGPLWKALGARIDACGRDEAAAAAMTDAACRAFAAIERWLCDPTERRG